MTIDVVTVWFNRRNYVRTSIGSLVAQTGVPLRIIAVDDGSTDGTGEMLREVAADAKARGVEMDVWSKPNTGFTDSLQQTLAARSQAEFVAIHDAADRSLPHRIERQLAVLRDDPDVVAVGSWVRILDDSGAPLRTRKVPPAYVDKHARTGSTRPGTHGCVLMRRDAYDEAGGYRAFFRFAQDADLWMRMNRLGRIVNVQEVLYEKVRTADSVSEDPRKTALQRAYSTLADQSAAAVDAGREDPIDLWERSGRVPRIAARRYLRRMGTLVTRTVTQRQLLTAARIAAASTRIVVTNRLRGEFDPGRRR